MACQACALSAEANGLPRALGRPREREGKGCRGYCLMWVCFCGETSGEVLGGKIKVWGSRSFPLGSPISSTHRKLPRRLCFHPNKPSTGLSLLGDWTAGAQREPSPGPREAGPPRPGRTVFAVACVPRAANSPARLAPAPAASLI